MARPLKRGLDYFPHDTDAMNDEKIEIMQLLYGNDGYAFYFKMLERIYRSADLTLDVSDAETRLVMIKKCNVDEERFDKMVSTALRQGLFDVETYEQTGQLTSKGILKRSEMVTKKRENMRERYSSKVSASETREETMSETQQTKQKETKQNKTKQNGKEKHGDNVALTAAEYQSLISTYGQAHTDQCIAELNRYKLETGKQYDNDCAAIKSWVSDRVKEQSQRQSTPRPKASGKPQMPVHQEQTSGGMTPEEREEFLRWAKQNGME
jgi:hypothetical protein